MNLEELLQELNQKNIQLSIDGDKLRYRGAKEVLTPTLLHQIRQYKAEIIQVLSNRSHSPSYHLSHGQQGLWFLYQLAPESAAYNLAFTVRIRSHLNVSALQRACQKLILRHPMLRTTFGQSQDELFQKVHEYQEIHFEEINAATWDWHDLTKRVIAAHRLPFDLEKGPVLRVTLFTRFSQDYVFLLAIHHIVVDGFSFGILLDELRLLYQAEDFGQEISLPPINSQYQDFVRYQHQMLTTPVAEELWLYWQRQLAGNLPMLKLPSAKVQNNQGACYTFNLTAELTFRLREMAKAEGVTLYMILLAAFVVLLHRYTNEEDILIGSPVNSRNRSEFDSVVGFFVNMLVLRVNLVGNPTFSAFLKQVRSIVLDALAHQDYPTHLLVERLQHKRNRHHWGLFQVSFNLLQLQQITEVIGLSMSSQANAIADWGGLSLEPFEIPQQEGQNDVFLNMVETAESLFGTFRYDGDECMTTHFQNILSAIAENPQQAVGELPLLSIAERHQLLREWNNQAKEYPSDQCIHQLFESQVEKTPQAVAVVFENEQLTYQELNQRANQLAHYLQSLGVKPEVLVGICVERSVDMVVGLLGILKAGGAYLPLDPNYPQKRLSYILADAAVGVLLTQHSLLNSLPSHTTQVVCLDTDWEIISQQGEVNPVSETTTSNLAYIIYTSGSTGNPKGVQIPHYNVVRLFAATQSWFNFNESDVWTFFHSYAFDFSVWEIWGALLHGGRLIVVSYLTSRSPESFYKLLGEEKVTVLNQTPSAFSQLIQADKSLYKVADLRLRLVIFGGEALELQSLEPWFEQHGDQLPQLVNMYGITETTVHVTYRPLTIADINLKASIIGSPIPDLQVYILDQNLQPIPIGVSGELYVGGAALARGYLNRPELTAEKFIPNPFSDDKSARLYKTGDLARYLSDGNIEFLGRIDNQVKIRGFRIELGEIEAVINTHPQIQQTVVIAREDIPSNKHLVAYIVASDKSLTSNQVRELLKQKLPEYMIPSTFVILDNLPLTPNGKIDRKALPIPDRKIIREKEYVAPTTPSEEIIADIFTKVLGVQNVSIDDNFFELGGHSLLATQLVSQLRLTLNIEIPLKTIFTSPTVAQLNQTFIDLSKYPTISHSSVQFSLLPSLALLASWRFIPKIIFTTHLKSLYLDQKPAINQPIASPLVKIQPGTKPPFFCVHPIGGDILCYVNLSQHLDPNQPFYGLQAAGIDGKQEPLADIKIIATHYIQALQTAQPQGPYFLGGWSMGGVIAWEMATQLRSQKQKVALLALIDAAVPTSMTNLTEIDDTTLLSRFVQNILGLSSEYTDFSVERLEEQSPEERLAYVMEQEQITNLPLRHLFHVFKTHFRAMQSYTPSVYTDRVTLFKASEQLTQDPTMGWGNITDQAVEIHVIPGNHYSIMAKPHVKILAEQLMISLHQAQASQPF